MSRRTKEKKRGSVGGFFAMLVFICIAIAMCSGDDSSPSSSSNSTTTTSSRTTSSSSSSSRQSDGSHRITDSGYYGCTSRNDFDELVTFVVQGDQSAFSSMLTRLVMAGRATYFEKGEKVYLMDTKIFSGMVQIRRDGETTKYWTNIEAI